MKKYSLLSAGLLTLCFLFLPAGGEGLERGGCQSKMEATKRISDQSRNGGWTSPLTFTILYDNTRHHPETRSDWGFSCLIEGSEKTILFDTGTRPEILLHNAGKLGVDLKKVECVVISHEHHDHIGGLSGVLDINPKVLVYLPKSFTQKSFSLAEDRGARAKSVDQPIEVCRQVYSTGEMGDRIREQSLVINTPNGLIIITGCSHQGIVTILKQARKMFDRPIRMIFGGFHLKDMKDAEVEAIIRSLREMGVEKCGPCHCTGERQIDMFRKAFGDNFVELGTGRILKITV